MNNINDQIVNWVQSRRLSLLSEALPSSHEESQLHQVKSRTIGRLNRDLALCKLYSNLRRDEAFQNHVLATSWGRSRISFLWFRCSEWFAFPPMKKVMGPIHHAGPTWNEYDRGCVTGLLGCKRIDSQFVSF